MENNLSTVVIEQRNNLGGVWNYSEAPDIITVMDSTITSSSATVTEAADFPMNPEIGQFMHRKDIQTYLENYAEHFDLYRHIHFSQRVEKVEKQEEWVVHCKDSCYHSRFLVVCAGPYQKKRDKIEEIRGFAGQVTHIGTIKSILPDRYCSRDHALVYGGGESASDVVELLAKTPARITWAIPNGQHFFRKANIFDRLAPGEYRQTDNPLDEAASKCIQAFCSMTSLTKSKPGMKWLCTVGSTGSFLGYEGHGIPEWKKGVPFLHAMINKNGHVIEHVYTGRATAQGKIASCEGYTVTFENGQSDDFSHVILCTGYESTFPYLPPQYAQKSLQERFKLIFDPDDTSLLFIGYARPNLGSIPLMAETQCLYAFKVLSGKTTLPDQAEMCTEIQKDMDDNDRFFLSKRRADGLVYPFIYGYDLANLAGVNPSYARIFFESPLAFFKTYFSPLSAAHLILKDKTRRRQAIDLIWSHQKAKWLVLPWVYLIARLLRIDPILHLLQERKYKKQLWKNKRQLQAIDHGRKR